LGTSKTNGFQESKEKLRFLELGNLGKSTFFATFLYFKGFRETAKHNFFLGFSVSRKT
jgi:hypothetical protein